MNYANIGERMAAFLVDLLLLYLFILLVPITLYAGRPLSTSFFFIFTGLIVLCYILMPLTPLEGTIGAYIFKLKVVKAHDGSRISFGQAVGRFFVSLLHFLSVLPFITVHFTEKAQAVHDMAAGTAVLRKSPNVQSSEPLPDAGKFYYRIPAVLLDVIIIVSVILYIAKLTDEALWAVLISEFVMIILYPMLMPLTKMKGTIGLFIFRLRVADEKSRGNISFKQAFIRYFTIFVYCASPLLYFLFLFKNRSQSVHDLAAHTYIAKARSKSANI
ncbi:RDD family protein [Bacillus amyloliquefaciens]|uniref:RDD family protein n=1 Tax=Bacillus amyloliquefaciens TaxID=1390 RepID=UPI002453498D|nr:RDD family protein [Bacillus amyloliquefaciens]MDH3088857.1 RDD family protein [Bacillus amyloliquefaciens]